MDEKAQMLSKPNRQASDRTLQGSKSKWPAVTADRGPISGQIVHHQAMAATAGSAQSSRDGRSCACSWPIFSPRTIAVTEIWADWLASVEKWALIYAQQAPSKSVPSKSAA